MKHLVTTALTVLFLGILVSGAAVGQSSDIDVQASVGLNKFDLFLQYLGRNGSGLGSSAYRKVSQAMARKAIVDAKNIGVTYFRISATGYAPSEYGEPGDLDLWQADPQAYWATFDTMMADLGAAGIRIVPVFVWNALQFPAITGNNTLSDLIADSGSASYRLLETYVRQFVQRYRDHPSLYFYELTNELNDHADIDLETLWKGTGPAGNFSTDQLLAFIERLAGLIRSLDPGHLISSGFNLPRRAAAHLRKQPDWLPTGGDWTADSPQEFKAHLAAIHEPLDIISIHFYNGIEDSLHPDMQRSNLRWGMTGVTNAGVLDAAKAAADSAGKLLFVGEFADENPYITENPQALFSQNVLRKIVELNIPFSAPWIWEFYQFEPYEFTIRNIEPGYADGFIDKIKEANRQLGNAVPEPAFPDTTSPQVILVWPLQGAVLNSPVQVAAVASDNHRISRVEFYMDQKLSFVDDTPPYGFIYDPLKLAAGEHRIEAVALDSSANRAVYGSTVMRQAPTPVAEGNRRGMPRSFRLNQNHPNPFNSRTTIAVELPQARFVTLAIYNVLGQEIATLVSKRLPAGKHQVHFDARGLPAGVYFYRLTAGKFTRLRKMLLLP